jgi:hypothetical protein
LGDIEDGYVVCPYHFYPFHLETGSCTSTSDLTAQTWKVSGTVLIDTKKEDPPLVNTLVIHLEDGWEVKKSLTIHSPNCTAEDSHDKVQQQSENGRDIHECKSLVEYAVRILNEPNPKEKCRLTNEAASIFLDDTSDGFPILIPRNHSSTTESKSLTTPPSEPPRNQPIQSFRNVAKYGKGVSQKSRVAILHNLANVELWAIDLCWDVIARFALHSLDGKGTVSLHDSGAGMGCGLCSTMNSSGVVELPRAFFEDFVQIAVEEAKHHTLLTVSPTLSF